MKKTFFFGIIILVVIVVVGVSLIRPSTKSKSQPPSPPLATVKIGIVVYPGCAPFFIAKEKEFFEKEGIHANIVVINDPAQIISALAGNDISISLSSTGFTSVIASAGIDIKEILAIDIGYGSDGLLVKNDISTINDLKGKSVYLDIGTPSHILLRYEAEQAGLQNQDIKLIQMGADQVGAAFVAGQIDYGMSWEPWLSKASSRKDGKILFSSREKPGIITDTLFVRTDFLNAHRNQVKAVLRAWFDSIDFIKNNPKEANEIMARGFNMNVEEFAAQVANIKFLDYQENLSKFDKNTDLNMFSLDTKASQILLEDGVIKKATDVEKLIDPEVLRDLYKN